MRKMAISYSLLVACAAVLLATLETTVGQEENPLKMLSTAIDKFSTELMIKLIESKAAINIVISPASIYCALGMLFAGAGGETKSQLASVLHLDIFESDERQFYESIKFLLQRLSSKQKGYTLKMVNRLYGQKGLDFKDEYRKKLDEYFRSELEELDFSGDPEGSRSKINNWVARMTSDKIKDLFPEGTITSETHFALVNADYFNSSWLYKFDKKNTKPQAFYTAENKKIQVPMMNLPFVARLSYHRQPNYEMLELPYAGGKVTSAIVLFNMNVTNNLLHRRRVLKANNNEISDLPKNMSVRISLPKFILNPTINLKDPLQALGLVDLFNPDTADLSDIDTVHSVPLSEAMHKSYIACNEEGMQVAGGSEGFIRRLSPFSNKPMDFIVDRPFMFLIYDIKTECILFCAYVTNPLQSD